MTPQRRRILFVHHGAGMGGAPQLLLKFLLHLDFEEYEPVVWCIRRSSASELFEKHGFNVIIDERACPFLHISDGFYGLGHPHLVLKMLAGQVRSFFTARRVFRTVRPDLIHLNSVVIPGVLCAAARQPCPVVVNVLESLHAGYTGFRKKLMIHCSLKWGDYFVFMLESEARKWGVAGRPNVTVIHDFIELDKFRAKADTGQLKKEYRVDEGVPLIGYLGRFTQAKGVHLLLRALGILKRKGVRFHVFLVGPLPAPRAGWRAKANRLLGRRAYMEQLHSIIESEELAERVTFTGERTNVIETVPQFDVLAVPFIEPHFSRLCGEAAAAGKVIVAFAIDGPGEEIVDGETGLLAQPFDVREFADKLELALTNPVARKRMEENALEHAQRAFNADVNFSKVLALYDQAFHETAIEKGRS